MCLLVDLERAVERFPEGASSHSLAGVVVPVIGLRALEASAPVKVRLALDHLGLEP